MPEVAVVRPDALRVVLFGMPEAGKSSLLGALAESARTQEHLLNGHLTDLANGLGELQQRLYEDRPRETLAEVAPYPATFEPFSGGGKREVVLIDCDGRAANELLARRKSLDGAEDTSLAGQVIDADTLVLVIDASANAGQIDADFGEFAGFLRGLRQSRGRSGAAGGLPVFLVLSKCDLLAKADDTASAWVERMEERKRQVRQRFQDFLAGQEGGQATAFGSLELHPWATAVKRPALVGAPARPREPYGVAELFRQCLDEASGYRSQKQASQRRLFTTVGGAVGLVASMMGLAAAFLLGNSTVKPSPLEPTVDNFRSNEGPTASTRLRADTLQRNLSLLTEVKSSPEFADLPPETQQYVIGRWRELKDYQAYRDRFLREPPPTMATTDEKLEELKGRLEGELLPPAEYQTEWAQTEAVLLREQRLDDVRAMREAVARVEDWVRGMNQKGEDLLHFTDFKGGAAPLAWNTWHKRLREWLAEADAPPFRGADKLTGSRNATYATVLAFNRVADARADLDKTRQRLEALRDLTSALGLGTPPQRPATLDIPVGFAIDQARGRWQELEKAYPGFVKWPELTIPDPAVAEVRRAAEASYRNAIAAGQEAILRQLQEVSPDGKETPARWVETRRWLAANPPELASWRQLTALLAVLSEPKAEDPVSALLEFLRQDRFDLDLRSLTLTLPDDLNVRPIGNLTIQHRSASENKSTLTFAQRGAPQRDAKLRLTRYTFGAEAATTLSYKPGDTLWAELPVSKDAEGRDRQLLWSGCRSIVFQFERLQKPPRLTRTDGKDSKVAEGVELSISPASGVPRVPALLPVVVLKPK